MQIHPYAEAAWSILSVAYKVVSNQMDLDSSVVDLVDAMTQMYDLVNAADCLADLSKNVVVKTILESMTRQTIECGYFIEDYCRRKAFCMYSGVCSAVLASSHALCQG